MTIGRHPYSAILLLLCFKLPAFTCLTRLANISSSARIGVCCTMGDMPSSVVTIFFLPTGVSMFLFFMRSATMSNFNFFATSHP